MSLKLLKLKNIEASVNVSGFYKKLECIDCIILNTNLALKASKTG